MLVAMDDDQGLSRRGQVIGAIVALLAGAGLAWIAIDVLRNGAKVPCGCQDQEPANDSD